MSYTIFDIAEAEVEGCAADRTRVLMARSALSVETFKVEYQRLISEPFAAHFEMKHFLNFSGQKRSYIVSAEISLNEAFADLAAQAEHYLLSKTSDDLQKVCSVVAAELWAAAHPTPSLFGEVVDSGIHLAAYHGPDSVSAASAIIARAAGKPIEPLPLDPDWPDQCFSMPLIRETLGFCELWVENLGYSWSSVLTAASQDLAWRTFRSRSYELSLLLARIVDSLSWR